ncbi:pentatricopeptide repeat-containing protein At3g61520, mitochondrial [Manihot esculenta]|uniref:Pentacotripeptide-repeat region of PRORP domain-containing protein n=1 Tax=Manihot esculenta TaxID=3983 RepID=A0A2C9WRC3_MANES|nr:pentatricopeptide repeat-containing protein At3g61520, mitochondrial [Manihot esculenta]OAY62235.1 hypothetical protein MANES_01G252300v8 [Manihot esculenta]
MSIALSTSKHPKLIRVFESSTVGYSLLPRRLSTEPTALPPPSRQQNDDSIVKRAVQLLKISYREWDTTQLIHLLFSDPAPSSRVLFQIARRLPSSSHALKFLQFLQEKSPFPDTQALSSTFQAILELASREPDSRTNLYDLYKVSKEWNIPLTINSATLLLRCFGRNGLVEESVILFNELEHSSKNTHVRNVLISVLLRAGHVDHAFKVVDEMLQPEFDYRPSDVTGDIIFSGLMKRGRLGRTVELEEIVELVLKFGQFGVFPNSIGITQIIAMLCRNGKTNKACDLFLELMNLGAALKVATCNALLTGLGKDRYIDRMNEVMARMKEMDIEPNVITYGILINHLCKFRRVDEALEVFQRMNGGQEGDGVSVEPDIVIFNTLIDGLCKVGRQEEGLGLLERMKLQRDCAPNTVTYNCLIDGFCKAGETESGLELFDEMTREGAVPNAVTVNTLVDGMCRNGRINSAVKFLDEMRMKGLKGDVRAYTSLINAFCNVNNIGKAMEIFYQMLREGCSPDAMAYYNLISGLTQARRMDDATSVLSKLKEAGFHPDIVCYNHMISGFCNKNRMDKVQEMLNDMEEAGVNPDIITYNTLISYFSKTGDFKIAHRMLNKMSKDGVWPTVVTYGALIHAYCLNGHVDEAMKIFRGMDATRKVAPNTVIYNILIDSLCKNNDVELALTLMDDMKVKAVRPTTTTYNAMFKGLRDKGLLKQTFELMDRMIEQACNPDYITMEILTEWLSAVGETEKLKQFVHGQKVSASGAFVSDSLS